MKIGDLVTISRDYEKWMLTEFVGADILRQAGWTRAEKVGIITEKNPTRFFVTWSDTNVTGHSPENLEVLSEGR